MTNQIVTNVDMRRKELRDLAFIQTLDLGPLAKKAAHDKILLLAFQLTEATL